MTPGAQTTGNIAVYGSAKQSFLDVISWDYDNIAAAVLRHAEFAEVRQSQ